MIKSFKETILLASIILVCLISCKKETPEKIEVNISKDIEALLKDNMLNNWYPSTIDSTNGGYYSDFAYNWERVKRQHKFIVTQARHLWTLSKVADKYPNEDYEAYAEHGFQYLKNTMWDSVYGGFYTIRDAQGKTTDTLGYYDEKRAYGNAFAVYGLAAYYKLSKDSLALDLAKKAYNWIETNAFDSINGGYFQYLTRSGKPFHLTNHKSKAYDSIRFPYKDQNTAIHMMEAYAELYRVWPDESLKKQLHSLLTLVRDDITTEKGTMNLFFDHQWKPVSFKDSTEMNYALDHVSFGHDVETAFLILDASEALGIKEDKRTLEVAKKMVDHSMNTGLDPENGGFYEKGYYFNDTITVVAKTKNWWSQSEGLNSFSLFSKLYPEEKKYHEAYLNMWEYINSYFIDKKYGGWYEKDITIEPEFERAQKGHIWKGSYHTVRSLLLCLKEERQ